jgi:hypothetical protein
MVSVLALAIAFSAPAPLEPPVDASGSAIGVAGSVSGAPAEEEGRPPLLGALQQAQHVVLAEVAATHDVAGETVEEATVTRVLKGSPGVSRVFYTISSCGCGAAARDKPKPGTPVLLLLTAGTEVEQKRSFWQALDELARPAEFFEVAWGGLGRLAADENGFVETWLALPDPVAAQPVAGGAGRAGVRRVALDTLVAWVEDRLAASGEPLR